MGNHLFSNSLERQWQQINENHLSLPGSPLLLKSKQNRTILAQKYILNIKPDHLSVPIYRLRKQKSKRIVSVLHYQEIQKCCVCETDKNLICVVTEHLPVRLSDIQDLSFNESVYLVCQILKGYQEIANLNFLVYPKANMIGFKENGVVKVWLNSNWSLNTFQKAKNQMSVIEQIIILVAEYCKDPQVRLLLDFGKIPKISFLTVIKFVEDKYKNILNQGKFLFQKRMHSIQINKYIQENNHKRPRAYSQGNTQYHNKKVKKPLSYNYNGKNYQNEIGQKKSKYNLLSPRNIDRKNPVDNQLKKSIHPLVKSQQMPFQNVLLQKPFLRTVSKNITHNSVPINFMYKNTQKKRTQFNLSTTNSPVEQYVKSDQNLKNKNIYESNLQIKKLDLTQTFNQNQHKNRIEEVITQQTSQIKQYKQQKNLKTMAQQFKYYLRSTSKAQKCDLKISIISQEPDIQMESEKNISYSNSVSRKKPSN